MITGVRDLIIFQIIFKPQMKQQTRISQLQAITRKKYRSATQV